MLKKILILVLLLGMVACDSVEEEAIQDTYYKWAYDDGFYYFRVPKNSKINQENAKIADCEVDFGHFEQSVLLDGECEYLAEDFGFRFKSEGKCCDYAEVMAETFTDEWIYVSDRFNFKIQLRYDFQNNYLQNDQGVVMRQIGEGGAPLEVIVRGEENLREYSDLGEFLAEKYPGFTYEFASFSNFTGVFVDESLSKGEAMRHFFIMSEDKETIIEAVMSFPRDKYTVYRDFLDAVLEKIELM